VPVIPPKGQHIRVIIDTDAKNEIDDQWAIALAILSPERFKIEGFVAAPYLSGGLQSVEKSAQEIELILQKAGLANRQYLHDYRQTRKYFVSAKKGFFDLGDIAALVDPGLASWETVACPEVDWDLSYKFKGTKGKILRCFDINRDKTFQLLYSKLRRQTGK
jgi:hypothetical protein